MIDLQLPPDLAYDVDNLGDGRLVIQHWPDGVNGLAGAQAASPSQ